MKALILILSAPLFFFSCNLNNKQPDGWKIFSTEKYSIQYPPEWKLDTTQGNVELFLFSSPEFITPLFSENINLIILPKQSDEPDSSDLEDFVTLRETQMKENGGTLLDSKRTKDSEGELHTLSYLGTFNNIEFKFKQQARMVDGICYVLTYTGKPIERDPHIKMVDQIFSSFIVK